VSFDADALLADATDARTRAYAPYSRFRVGAAVLTSSGTVYKGCNVENVSYPLTNCAERVALQSAIAAGEQAIVAVAIVTGAAVATPPCGACRQVLAEFGTEISVVLPGGEGPDVKPLRDYLPFHFGRADLVSGQDPAGD
jgi:cytidine deaminase